MALPQDATFIETVNDPEMLKYLDYLDDRAEILVPGSALDYMPFKTERFIEDDEYWALFDDIKARGFDSSKPIHVRPGPQGSWVVDIDDTPRFIAAKRVANDFFANLLSQKVQKVRFVLHNISEDGKYKVVRVVLGEGD